MVERYFTNLGVASSSYIAITEMLEIAPVLSKEFLEFGQMHGVDAP